MRWVWALFRREALGLLQDFWKDGKGFSVRPAVRSDSISSDPNPQSLWHAKPGEIEEKMWGSGSLLPAEELLYELLSRPLNLNKDMKVLDLTAGIGHRMGKLVRDFNCSVEGRETNPELAVRGQTLLAAEGFDKKANLTLYNPDALLETQTYTCVIARELLSRVSNKETFVRALVDCCTKDAQFSFSDYIVNPEDQNQPAILAWKAFEPERVPLSLVDMAELWAKAGVTLRVHDEQTDMYEAEIKQGLLRLAQFMGSGVRPDYPTKKAINQTITLWAHRAAAFEQGMKFYRFYGKR
ncbi:MAG: methyltransferase domain-containing protein [Alphaproteobacteria bacterium]|nr:methyltransferase domain-containing protein [Alphaproteobacteria bacterium]